MTQKSQVIADNWDSIASRAQVTFGFTNTASVTIGDVLGQIVAALESAVSETETLVSDVQSIISLVATVA